MSRLGGRPMSEFTDREEQDLRAASAPLVMTVTEATSTTLLAVGDTIILSDRGYSSWDVISGTGTANTFSILANTGASQSLSLITSTGEIDIESLGAVSDSGDYTTNVQHGADLLETAGGGTLVVPNRVFKHSGLTLKSNVGIKGTGFRSELENVGVAAQVAILYEGVGSDTTSTDRVIGQLLRDLAITGNASSGDGVVFELSGSVDNGTVDKMPNLAVVDHCSITGHGQSGVRFGTNATFGAGNKLTVTNSHIAYNGNHGVEVPGQSNLVSITNNNISNNTVDGVQLNFVSSTNTVMSNGINDNGRFGVHCISCEEPFIVFNGFNRNNNGAVVLTGSGTKVTEAAVVLGNLFGDNGSGQTAGNQREVQATFTIGSSIVGNYFFGTGQDVMIALRDEVDGMAIRDNHFKGLTTEIKLEVKVGAVNTNYIFEDTVSEGTLSQITTNKVFEHTKTSGLTIFRHRAEGNSQDFFSLKASGDMRFGDGTLPPDIGLSRVTAGALRVDGSFEMDISLDLADGVTAPAVKTGFARMYVDVADGDLKIKFADGTVKTIVTDT